MTPSEASDHFLAVAFIENANSSRYNLLWRELTNGISMKQDLYPKTLAEAVHLLTHWKGTPNKNVRLERGGPRSSHISFHQNSVEPLMTPEIQRFLQLDGTVAGSDGRVQSSVTCFRCHNRGHYATSCPTLTSENGTFSDFCFAQGSGTLSPTLLIIDTGSTFNSFSNKSYRPASAGPPTTTSRRPYHRPAPSTTAISQLTTSHVLLTSSVAARASSSKAKKFVARKSFLTTSNVYKFLHHFFRNTNLTTWI